MKLLLMLLFSLSLKADITVWIIDTGLDLSHPEVTLHIAKGQNLNSFNYIDNHGHGTHVSGIITNGICDKVKIVSCKYYFMPNESKQQTSDQCFELALKNHANYINFSSGGASFDQIEKDLLEKLLKSGTIIVSSAGNDGQFNPNYYPPAYGFKNLIVVGNLDITGIRHKTSNYGFTDMIWEIGTNIWSTIPNGRMGFMTGTSQATAIHTNKLLKAYCDRNN